MSTPKIHESEYRLCLIVWEREPLSAVELAKLCRERLGWERTTTYTVVKRLCGRGILRTDDGIVTAVASEADAPQSDVVELVEIRFEGSLPAFIAAFTRSQKLSDKELDEVQSMIDRIRWGETK